MMTTVIVILCGAVFLPTVVFGRFVKDGLPMDWEGKLENLLNPDCWNVDHHFYDFYTFELEEIHMRRLMNGDLAILFKCGEAIGEDTIRMMDGFSQDYAGEEGGWFFGSASYNLRMIFEIYRGKKRDGDEIAFDSIPYSVITEGDWAGNWREVVFNLDLGEEGDLLVDITIEGSSPNFDPWTLAELNGEIYFDWENTGVSELIQSTNYKTEK